MSLKSKPDKIPRKQDSILSSVIVMHCSFEKIIKINVKKFVPEIQTYVAL